MNDDNRSKFRTAIDNVRNSLRHITTSDGSNNNNEEDVEMEFALTHTTIRNVEMLTLGTNDAGFPFVSTLIGLSGRLGWMMRERKRLLVVTVRLVL